MDTIRYIVLDTETGGIGLDKSLLTAYFEVVTRDFSPWATCFLRLKPDDDVYRVSAEGLEVNKINLVEHNKTAVTYKQGGTHLYEFLKTASEGGKIKLIPTGHGMSGDLDHIFDKLVKRSTWETFVSYRRLDTSVLCNFLRLTGYLPETVSGGLENLAEFFGFDKQNVHTADGDVKLIIKCLESMTKMFSKVDPVL